MYQAREYVSGLDNIAKVIGIGRNNCLFLCQTKPHGFPVVRIGNRYQADRELLDQWQKDWYQGKFEIVFRRN